MPKIEPRVPLEVRLERIESASALFAEKASKISDFIQLIDERLRALPGKVEVGIAGENCAIEFARSGTNWGLWFFDGGSSERSNLTCVSIERKAQAIPILIELIRLLEEKQVRQLQLLNEAHALVREFNESESLKTEGR